MDSSSRRAFALDSRTVWVEQQLRGNVILAKDNLPLGPGEYTPKIPERHVYTPALGKFRSPADSFKSFNSDLSIRSPSKNSTNSTAELKKLPPPTGGSEFTTIFHEHDIRQPLDPNKRFTETPGCYLGQDDILKTINHDGIKNVESAIFGSDVTERIHFKIALPTYDINYDSKHIKPVAKLGSFDKEKRVLKLGQPCYYDQAPASPEERPKSPYQLKKEKKELEGSKSVFEQRCALVPLPKLKVRHPEVLTFNASSYVVPKWNGPISLTPKRINREASVHVYDKILAIPRKHISTGYTKPSSMSI